MIKFYNKQYLAVAFIFIGLAAVETTFNAATYAYIFKVIEEKDTSLLLKYIILVVLGYILFSIITYLKDFWTNKNIAFFNTSLKTELIRKILEKETSLSKTEGVSSNTSFFMNDLKLLEENYVKQLFNVVSYLVTLVVILTFSMSNSFLLTVIFLVFTSVTPLFTNIYKEKIEESNSHWTKENKSFSSILKDILSGAETIASYKSENYFIKKFYLKVKGLEESTKDMNNAISLSNALVIALSYLFLYLPIGMGIYFTIQGRISLASFVAVQYSSSWIINNFLGLSQCINKLNSIGEIKKTIINTLEFKQPDDTNVLRNQKIDSVVFQNVSFNYEDKKIFEHLDLTLNSNDNVLLEGASGSGKSTFLKLLTKKLTPTNGEIFINGEDMKSISKSELYNYVSLIPQTVAIFNDTLRNNITLGKEVSEEKLSEAIKKAGLEELIQQVGLNYLIGEDGERLSGGQLKRVEIARAILFDKPILLIDEGNASLDKQNALAINKTVANLNKLVIDVEHYVPEESMKNYTRKYYLESRRVQPS
ncbi:ATP-binding cassette domain-containing protein [Aerococcus urinaeequi]|uniref:ATP-binding cassette domain-containing protein n=1 Tax=Aerococcus urinaeequi TaxID=51665 RepID=UPI003D6B65EF